MNFVPNDESNVGPSWSMPTLKWWWSKVSADVEPTLTQSEDAQSNDNLFTGGDSGDQSVQNAVIAHKRHHGLRKLRITGNIHRSAAVKHR